MAIVLCVCLSAQNGGPGLELSAMSNIINFRLQECENPRDIIEQGTDIPKMNVFSCAITDTVCVWGGPPSFLKKNVFAPLGCLANVRHLLVDKPDVVFQHGTGQPRSCPVVWFRTGSPCLGNCFSRSDPPPLDFFFSWAMSRKKFCVATLSETLENIKERKWNAVKGDNHAMPVSSCQEMCSRRIACSTTNLHCSNQPLSVTDLRH